MSEAGRYESRLHTAHPLPSPPHKGEGAGQWLGSDIRLATKLDEHPPPYGEGRGGGGHNPRSPMLGRTAQNLFWLSRYVERAENMARLLEVGYRMSLTSHREGGSSEHLVSMLQAAEVAEEFGVKHKVADVQSVSQFMLFDETNPSSVRSCLLAARTNARSVRTALTSDMWESLNSAWLEFAALDPREVSGSRLVELLRWVRTVSHRYRGALLSTFLRDDGYAFSQIGNFVERADNTARILDFFGAEGTKQGDAVRSLDAEQFKALSDAWQADSDVTLGEPEAS